MEVGEWKSEKLSTILIDRYRSLSRPSSTYLPIYLLHSFSLSLILHSPYLTIYCHIFTCFPSLIHPVQSLQFSQSLEL